VPNPGGLKLFLVGRVLVFLMATLQLAYALYAYVDPAAFAGIRGTRLLDAGDADWVRIYGSRTLFIALIVGYLLYVRQFRVLAMAALIALVMPVTDALLAHQAAAGTAVLLKHVLTAVFLLVTFLVLRKAVARDSAV